MIFFGITYKISIFFTPFLLFHFLTLIKYISFIYVKTKCLKPRWTRATTEEISRRGGRQVSHTHFLVPLKITTSSKNHGGISTFVNLPLVLLNRKIILAFFNIHASLYIL